MIRSLPADFLAVVRDGVRIWWLAPLIPLLVVLPEAAQHVAEIRLGMFDGIERARAVADSSARMGWGYLKIAGLVLAILAAVRFWGARTSNQPWWTLRGVAWRPLGLGVLLFAVSSVPGLLLEPSIGTDRAGWVDIVLSLATLPLFALLAAGFSGDRSLTLRRAYTWGWLPALRILLFVVVTFAPLAYLHTLNHRWAMGAADAQVWALMAFDSLVVGLMATMTGTAIHHGYAPPPAAERHAPRPIAAA